MNKRRAIRPLNEADERRLRSVLGVGEFVASARLARRLMDECDVTRASAYNIVRYSEATGLIEVAAWVKNRRIYALNAGWKAPAGRKPSPPPAPKEGVVDVRAVHQLVTSLPAAAPGPLVPSLGVGAPDPEVMPPEVHAAICGLFRRIFEHETGVE